MEHKRKYSNELVQAIKDYLEEDDFMYSFNEEYGFFDLKIRIRGKFNIINLRIIVQLDNILIIGQSPISVDDSEKDTMIKMAEFICRANFGLNNGNFEFDMNDGDLRYKCNIDCSGNQIPNTYLIRNCMMTVGRMLMEYSDGILGIIFGEDDPKNLVEKCEQVVRENALKALKNMFGEEAPLEGLGKLVSAMEESEELETEPLEVIDENCEYNIDLFSSENES